MRFTSVLFCLATLSMSAPAFGAADLKVTVPAPAAVNVYSPTSYAVKVQNIGNVKADNISLTVTLPLTHTSPTAYVMGTLSAIDTRCVKSNNKLVCSLGSLNNNKSTTVTFKIALPEANEVLKVTASATTTSSETVLTNNSATDIPALTNYSYSVPGGSYVTNEHCTGTNLTSYFECTLFPSSIMQHDTILNGDGSVTVVDDPINYYGTWSQPVPNQLNMQYFDSQGTLLADFVGYGTPNQCFEGITIFPGSSYVSPYHVCF